MHRFTTKQLTNRLAYTFTRHLTNMSSKPKDETPNTSLKPKYESFLHYASAVILFPLSPMFLHNVPKQHKYVITRFGRYERCAEEGLRYITPLGTTITEVFIGNESFKTGNLKIVDSSGKPLIISAIVNFNISCPEKFVFNINENKDYINNITEQCVKSIVSKYSYDELRKIENHINNELKNSIQQLTDIGGYTINSVNIIDINYAPEIAQQMLVKQQAEAYNEAKEMTCKAAVDIANSIVKEFPEMSNNQKHELIRSIIVTITSGGSVQQTMNVNK